MKAKEIQELISFIAESGLAEVNIETDEFKLAVKRQSDAALQAVHVVEKTVAAPMQMPVVTPAVTPVVATATSVAAAPAAGKDESKYKTIKSPMIGTFYRSANPESPVFVQVGDQVKAGQTVCIVEAMKLFNEIDTDLSGTIVKVLVENASPVEYDQPLFLIDPA
ncbi:MAG: acetyl-CoA carboxylase biotin carboxyl carrier protein [Cytophagales bacterium]|nr:MAG: acetyl-CoA carboxylase biotin carboxyl carrier protein [Cytophagales bacterium]TAF60162.1 MAG: acetyl-CoA carboxylase biotin carboxyl carrier protein [Cytophagales bacterium]